MKSLILSLSLLVFLGTSTHTFANNNYEQLDDIIELNNVKQIESKIVLESKAIEDDASTLHRLRLGILHHQAATTSAQIDKTTLTHAEKSYTILTILRNDRNTPSELRPIVEAYHASSLAILGYHHKNSELIHQAFFFLDQAVNDYDKTCFVPRYLRAKIAQHLPKYYAKRTLAKRDLDMLIDRFSANNNFTSAKIMSYVYCYWAELHQNNKQRNKALHYLEQAIDLDPNDEAAGPLAKNLLARYNYAYNKTTAER